MTIRNEIHRELYNYCLTKRLFFTEVHLLDQSKTRSRANEVHERAKELGRIVHKHKSLFNFPKSLDLLLSKYSESRDESILEAIAYEAESIWYSEDEAKKFRPSFFAGWLEHDEARCG